MISRGRLVLTAIALLGAGIGLSLGEVSIGEEGSDDFVFAAGG